MAINCIKKRKKRNKLSNMSWKRMLKDSFNFRIISKFCLFVLEAKEDMHAVVGTSLVRFRQLADIAMPATHIIVGVMG